MNLNSGFVGGEGKVDELTKNVQLLAQEQVRMSEQIKILFTRIDEQKELTESVHKLATSVEMLAMSQKETKQKVEKLSCEIDLIKEKPARRLDGIVTVAITSVVTAIITFMLTKIGLK